MPVLWEAIGRCSFLRVAVLGTTSAALAACAPAASAPASAPVPSTPATAPTTASVAKAPWEEEWERVLASAGQEGVVLLAGPPGDLYREALVAFERSYPSIKVEY